MISLRVLSLFAALVTVNVSAQIVAAPSEDTCTTSATLSVTVTDATGAVIQNAFVMLRAEGPSVPNAQPFQLELQTNLVGKAIASVPCGYMDIFSTSPRFTPHTEKLLIAKVAQSVSVALQVDPTPNILQVAPPTNH